MAREIHSRQALEYGSNRRQSVVKLYVEGGAQDSALERSLCRQAFQKFFAADPSLKGKLPRTVPCGGRDAAYDAFVTAINNPKSGSCRFCWWIARLLFRKD